MRGLFRFLQAERYVKVDPTRTLDGPKLARKLPEILTVAEVDRVLAAPDRKTPEGLRDAAMIETMYATGLRVSELVGLKVEDVDLRVGVVRAFGKGRKQRLVPLGDQAKDLIVQYLADARPRLLKGRVAAALFVTRRGGGMTRQRFWQLLLTHVRSADVTRRVSPHKLRHSFATHLLLSLIHI